MHGGIPAADPGLRHIRLNQFALLSGSEQMPTPTEQSKPARTEVVARPRVLLRRPGLTVAAT
jgi:hypothetical protein